MEHRADEPLLPGVTTADAGHDFGALFRGEDVGHGTSKPGNRPQAMKRPGLSGRGGGGKRSNPSSRSGFAKASGERQLRRAGRGGAEDGERTGSGRDGRRTGDPAAGHEKPGVDRAGRPTEVSAPAGGPAIRIHERFGGRALRRAGCGGRGEDVRRRVCSPAPAGWRGRAAAGCTQSGGLRPDRIAQVQSSTTFPDCPDIIVSKPVLNSATGKRWVMTGEISNPARTMLLILYQVSNISRP